MRKLTLLLGAVAALALAAPTLAAAPARLTIPFAGLFNFPAGEVCDFEYTQVFSGTDEVTFFSDGRVQVHEDLAVTHTNVGTGFTLTEIDQLNFTFLADGTEKDVGIFWHLRDASGKLVVVHAGQIRADADGNVVKFTPNTDPDFAAVICPALGGNPAP